MKTTAKRFLTISLLMLVITGINAQSQKFHTVLYGVAYYHEYMPYDRLDKDVQLMQDAGISVVRLGESTWSLFEPQEAVSYTHLRAHETRHDLVCRLLLE